MCISLSLYIYIYMYIYIYIYIYTNALFGSVLRPPCAAVREMNMSAMQSARALEVGFFLTSSILIHTHKAG